MRTATLAAAAPVSAVGTAEAQTFPTRVTGQYAD